MLMKLIRWIVGLFLINKSQYVWGPISHPDHQTRGTLDLAFGRAAMNCLDIAQRMVRSLGRCQWGRPPNGADDSHCTRLVLPTMMMDLRLRLDNPWSCYASDLATDHWICIAPSIVDGGMGSHRGIGIEQGRLGNGQNSRMDTCSLMCCTAARYVPGKYLGKDHTCRRRHLYCSGILRTLCIV